MEVQNLLKLGQIWSQSHQLTQIQDGAAEQDSAEGSSNQINQVIRIRWSQTWSKSKPGSQNDPVSAEFTQHNQTFRKVKKGFSHFYLNNSDGNIGDGWFLSW